MTDDPVKRYQDALRAFDNNPTEENHKLLNEAKEAYEIHKKTKINAAYGKVNNMKLTTPSRSEQILTEYQKVKKELKAANERLKRLRDENKELREAYKLNVKEKQQYNYEIIPTLRKRKKQLEAENK